MRRNPYNLHTLMVVKGLWPSMESGLIMGLFPAGYRGTIVEVGAFDGQTGSVSQCLESIGWNALCIEPNPYISINRPNVVRVACGDHDAEDVPFFIYEPNPASFSALDPIKTDPTWRPGEDKWQEVRVPLRRLTRLLDEHHIKQLDALIVDVEGGELDVLKGADLPRWCPKVVIVESWQDESEACRYMEVIGYAWVGTIGVNDIFVPRVVI